MLVALSGAALSRGLVGSFCLRHRHTAQGTVEISALFDANDARHAFRGHEVTSPDGDEIPPQGGVQVVGEAGDKMAQTDTLNDPF